MNDALHPIMAAILAPWTPPPRTAEEEASKRLIPMDRLNQDDWYVFDKVTGELFYILSSKYQKPAVKPGQAVMRGMGVQFREIQLWSKS